MYLNKNLDYKEINLKTNFDEYIAIEVKMNDVQWGNTFGKSYL